MSKSVLVGGVVALIALLAGCSSPQTADGAEAAFTNAHDQCVEGLPKSLVVSNSIFTAGPDEAFLTYKVEEGQSTTLVKCVSRKLIGQDLTKRVFKRSELLYFQQRTGDDSSEIPWDFSTQGIETWDKPFDFYSSESPSGTFFAFSWRNPSASE